MHFAPVWELLGSYLLPYFVCPHLALLDLDAMRYLLGRQEKPLHQKAPKPLAPLLTPFSLGTPKWELLWQWVQPRQTLPTPSPCIGHLLYLPQQGAALHSQPSTICPPVFSSLPILGLLFLHPWHPHRWQSQVNNLCGTSWVLPYPPSQSLLPQGHRYHLHPSQLVFSHMGSLEPSPLCLLK